MKENVWGVKVRWLTKAVFLGLKEKEYQSIQWLATTNRTIRDQKAYLKQKTYQSNVWHKKEDLKKKFKFFIFFQFLWDFKKMFLK